MTKINFERLTNPTLINLPTLVQNTVRTHRANNEDYESPTTRENFDASSPDGIISIIIYFICFIAVIYLASRRYTINKWSYGVAFWLGWIFFGALIFPAFALLILIVIFITQGYQLKNR
jgi:hypothetical protein